MINHAPPAQSVVPDVAPPVRACVEPEDALRSFEDEMRRHNQRLFRLAFALVGDESEAEDVLQDSYVRAFEHLSTFAGRSGIGIWLARIVRNQAIDHLRLRQARQAAIALEAELPAKLDGGDGYLERAAAPPAQSDLELERSREEVRAVLQQAIAMLPARFRVVFMLREVEGLSVEDTAAYLGIPVATVKSRDHRARKLLRAELGPALDGGVGDVFEFLRERCDRIVARVRALLTSS
ncbi:MAG TPA: RNA polymerase sigma factor [Steroidobacteraceae bacterium]|nr:RNA polymerase sigma factor [Steroidobacteraceae bacterium]